MLGSRKYERGSAGLHFWYRTFSVPRQVETETVEIRVVRKLKNGLQKNFAGFILVLSLALPLVCNAQGSTAETEVRSMSAGIRGRSLFAPNTPISVLGCESEAAGARDRTLEARDAVIVGLAIADFTGDSNPDLATIELDRLDSSNAQYSIQIRLTEGGRQSLTVTGPFGGLLVTPKDVTGDGTLDLVVRSASSRRPIAIFINDGCGHFFRAPEPFAFAPALQGASSSASLATEQIDFGATVVYSESYAARCERGCLWSPQARKGSPFLASYGAPLHSLLRFGLNRAPPAVA
jgi:hypothetical protein